MRHDEPGSPPPTREGLSSEAGFAPDWRRIALFLVVATLVYNVLEAVLALWAGIDADSIALVGFGLDSIIETAAACALLYRISLESRGTADERLERTEHRVHEFVGITFLVLAAYVSIQSGWVLWTATPPEESTLGIVLATVSLVVMPLVSWGKLRAAKEIGSAALRAEAKETLACSYLSFTLLLGLAANAVGGWWWADPGAALLMVPWLVREGVEGLRGESCCEEPKGTWFLAMAPGRPSIPGSESFSCRRITVSSSVNGVTRVPPGPLSSHHSRASSGYLDLTASSKRRRPHPVCSAAGVRARRPNNE